MTKRVSTQMGMLALVVLLANGANAQNCIGDCNQDGAVPINELVLLVNIAGGRTPLASCSPGVIDDNGNGSADIDELVSAVVSSISVCGTVPTPTFTPTISAADRRSLRAQAHHTSLGAARVSTCSKGPVH